MFFSSLVARSLWRLTMAIACIGVHYNICVFVEFSSCSSYCLRFFVKARCICTYMYIDERCSKRKYMLEYFGTGQNKRKRKRERERAKRGGRSDRAVICYIIITLIISISRSNSNSNSGSRSSSSNSNSSNNNIISSKAKKLN